MEDFMLPCLSKQIFGLDCPGCGAQRALFLVIRGEFLQAFKMFPAIYSILLLLTYLLGNFFVRFRGEQKVRIGLILFAGTFIAVAYLYKIFYITNQTLI